MSTHDYTLVGALIEALGDLGYTPAVDELFKLRGTDNDAEATRALSKLAPDRLTSDLLATAKDKQIDSYVRERAMVTLCNISATNRVRDLIPLLDDTTPIVYERTLPGPEWRVCDRAAATIAVLLGWQDRMLPIFVRPEQREETMNRVRDWARQAQ
jgi:HEAT repeat protein